MEVELGWGIHDTGNFDRLSDGGEMERRYLSKLLEVTDETGVPITFDVVGHLFLNSCSGSHAGPHEDGWFRSDPGTDAETDGLFYAPDVVSAIQGAETDHELCTHTFSHVLFDAVPREVCEWELNRVQELHREYDGGPTKSLVPPRHKSPPYDALVDNGIEVFRPAMDTPERTKPHRFKELLSGPLPPSNLRERDGIVETYVTTYPSLTAASLPSGRGASHPVFRYLPVELRKYFHLRNLKQATRDVVESGSHLHLWCHLFDISNEPQFDVVREYLRWLAEFERERELTTAPMESLPSYV